MGIAIIPTTIFSYSYLVLQTPLSRNGACTALSGVGVLAHKWLFAAANMVRGLLLGALHETSADSDYLLFAPTGVRRSNMHPLHHPSGRQHPCREAVSRHHSALASSPFL
jgi:hypothetical protein